MKLCSICKKNIESKEPAVLTMSGFGHPRHICEECEADLDNATLSKEPEIISDAIEKIGEKMRFANNDDALVLSTVSSIIEAATVRGEEIKNGTYDFQKDEDGDASAEDIPEELLETEEDRELDKKEQEATKKAEKYINWVTTAIFIAAMGFIAYWIITKIF